MTHFYNEAVGDRYEKTADALHGVGISIVGGAVTTGGAAIPLLFANNFVFFKTAGYFIISVRRDRPRPPGTSPPRTRHLSTAWMARVCCTCG